MAEETKTTTQEPAEGMGNQAGAEQTQMTFDEVLQNRDFQSEFDRRIAKALDTAREKWESETAERVEEAKRTAKMTAEQKAEYARAQAEEALSRREAEVTRRELRADAIAALSDRKLPLVLADVLDYSDEAACKRSMQAVETAFGQAVEQAVNDRLRSDVPKAGNGEAQVTKEQFSSMTYAQRAELYETNRQRYNELVGGM